MQHNPHRVSNNAGNHISGVKACPGTTAGAPADNFSAARISSLAELGKNITMLTPRTLGAAFQSVVISSPIMKVNEVWSTAWAKSHSSSVTPVTALAAKLCETGPRMARMHPTSPTESR